jgi:hypothetical protein
MCHLIKMAPFLFRCPNTRRRVQGWIADDPSGNDSAYAPVQCVACRQVHYVNPGTGRVLGGNEDE